MSPLTGGLSEETKRREIKQHFSARRGYSIEVRNQMSSTYYLAF
jgi:hypothetical protein